jgi:hypothetical protein
VAKTQGTDVDRTMVETHWRASSETNSHVIYRHLIKKVEQDTAHSIFYHEFSILYFIW